MTDNEPRGINSSALKIIAIIAMTCNHIAHVFGGNITNGCIYAAVYAAGGLTFPVMAFLLVEGYYKTKSVYKYAMRLLIFGCVSLVPFWLAFGEFYLNVLFTLLLGLIALYLYDLLENRRALFLILFILIFAAGAYCDWAYIGVPFIFAVRLARKINNKAARAGLPYLIIIFQIAVFIMPDCFDPALKSAALNDLYFMIISLLSAPLVYFYNGKRGFKMKYAFYAYYPAHLIILVLVKALM